MLSAIEEVLYVIDHIVLANNKHQQHHPWKKSNMYTAYKYLSFNTFSGNGGVWEWRWGGGVDMRFYLTIAILGKYGIRIV